MSELDVTAFVTAYADCMEYFSCSIASSGLQNIGAITWRNAVDVAHNETLTAGWDADELVGHFADYGAWDRSELEAMPEGELFALLMQFIAGDYQRYVSEDFDAQAEGGNLYKGDDERWYYSVGG
jgi:hypothetical protein